MTERVMVEREMQNERWVVDEAHLVIVSHGAGIQVVHDIVRTCMSVKWESSAMLMSSLYHKKGGGCVLVE